MEQTIAGCRVRVLRGDITEQAVDAIVNAANSGLLGGGGVDGAIHRRGGPSILADCERIRTRRGGCPTGEAVVTGAGDLPARWVIHAVGPVWRGGEQGEEGLLRSAYQNSLRVGATEGARTVAFPSISTGAYRYPIAAASRVALRAVADGLAEWTYDEVRMVLFSEEDLEAYTRAFADLFGSSRGSPVEDRR